MDHEPAQNAASNTRETNPIEARARKKRWRRVRWTIRLVALGALVGMFVVGFDRLFYYPDDIVYCTPSELGLQHKEVFFRTADGVRLCGWFLPAEKPARGTVIHFHGNAANITNHFVLSAWLVPAGYNVFVFDYRGYGKSESRVTRAGTICDGNAALDYVLARDDVDPQRVFAFGQSLGGAVATVVAAQRPEIRAVVLDSTFSSYRRIGARHLQKMLFFRPLTELIARLGLSGKFEPRDYIARIAPRPLLVIASRADQVCFAELGRELFDAAAEPKTFILVDESGHLETVCDNVGGVQQRMLSFFDEAQPVEAG